MRSLSLASLGGCHAVGVKMGNGRKGGSAPSSSSETQRRAAIGVSFGVRTRHGCHTRLAMGGEAGRAVSRTQGTFASNGGAVAPLSDGDADGGSQDAPVEESLMGDMIFLKALSTKASGHGSLYFSKISSSKEPALTPILIAHP